MIRVLLLIPCLAACAPDLPPADGTISAAAQASAFPELVPLTPLLAEAARPSRAAVAQDALLARGARLSGRRIIGPATGDLAERGRRLRARAAELRAAEV
ncbi:hypothetical protein ACK8OR_01580 [Jannaschia sp. KMU-145]|uniref:hypothetical protein n=1 Tax=Jannaschia halovivens TaxID=3388667 RepID=UPI00396B1760